MAIQDFTVGQILTAAQMDALQGNDYNQTVSTKTANYVLVAADKGTRVTMNSASATTITVNTSLFAAGDTLKIQNIGAGVCTVTAGTATVTTAGSLAVSQYGGGELYFTSTSAAIFFPSGGKSVTKYITKFTSSGTYTPDPGVTYAIAYIQAGGGGVSRGAVGGTGGTSSVAFAAGTVSATGGFGGYQFYYNTASQDQPGAANSGTGGIASSVGSTAPDVNTYLGSNGALITAGGVVSPGVGITVTVGAGGTATNSGTGGSGYIFIEWYA